MVELEIIQSSYNQNTGQYQEDTVATVIVDDSAENPDRRYRSRGDRGTGEMIRGTHVEDAEGNRLTYETDGEYWAENLPYAFEQGDGIYARVAFTTPNHA